MGASFTSLMCKTARSAVGLLVVNDEAPSWSDHTGARGQQQVSIPTRARCRCSDGACSIDLIKALLIAFSRALRY